MRFADWNKIEMCVYYDVCNKCVWIWMVDAIVDDIDVDDDGWWMMIDDASEQKRIQKKWKTNEKQEKRRWITIQNTNEASSHGKESKTI